MDDKEIQEELKNRFISKIWEKLFEFNKLTKEELIENLIYEFLSNIKKFTINNITIHIPNLIAIAMAFAMKNAFESKDKEYSYNKICGRIKEEIEKRKDYNRGFV